jgi:UDP-N-acetylmuramyl pentapeptide phosphotransferase/UDP-N-acetylglucosamine-1-phosphate transferase
VAGLGFISVGAADDRFSFHPRQKFLVFLVLSALAAWPWIMVLRTTGIPWLPQPIIHSPLMLLVTSSLLVFWFMAVPNAVNIEDAINGYMGGYTLIVMSTLFIHGVDTRITLGALAGFLVLNWPRAKHFMGDAGSFGCGFFIAEGILQGGGLTNPFLALILTAPISIDVTMGLIRRKRLKMSFFKPDRATCPHHVLTLFNGNVIYATSALFINVTIFTILTRYPLAALVQSLFYFIFLIFLNHKYVFSKPYVKN